MKVIVIGGGAAGFFGAIAAANVGHDVTILEAASSCLAKVRVSGGGRCNLTHHCFDPRQLVANYPRGGKALRGPFSRFQPSDTVAWFQARGVETKVESDGRMFPVTDDSATIVDCLYSEAQSLGVEIQNRSHVDRIDLESTRFVVHLKDGRAITAAKLLLATGGSKQGLTLAASLGHDIVPPVPSLFTFNVRDCRLKDLQGISVQDVQCELLVGNARFRPSGAILVTHWGLSGPSVLKLSAWAARELHDASYQATLRINWLPSLNQETLRSKCARAKLDHARKSADTACPVDLPKRLWKSIVESRVGEPSTRWADLSKSQLNGLVQELHCAEFLINGKGIFKEEFVTCGGVDLKQVDFRSMQSRIREGVFFAGEILDVDGVTGGFNFQNAWTTAWIAGNSM